MRRPTFPIQSAPAAVSEVERASVHVGPASHRWAAMVAGVLGLDRDIRTVEEWARVLGMSPAAIKCRCGNAGVSAKDTLDFARLLRVIVRRETEHWPPRDVLDIVDPRTLRRLFERGGISLSSDRAPRPGDFLTTQRLVTSRALLTGLTSHLCGAGWTDSR